MGSRTARGPVLPHSGCAFEGRGKEPTLTSLGHVILDAQRRRRVSKVKTAPCRGGERAGPVLRNCRPRPPCVGTSLPVCVLGPPSSDPGPPALAGLACGPLFVPTWKLTLHGVDGPWLSRHRWSLGSPRQPCPRRVARTRPCAGEPRASPRAPRLRGWQAAHL